MTMPVTQHTDMLPKYFEVPPENPSPSGLYAATNWEDDPNERWRSGVQFRGLNYGGHNAFGVWEPAYYCAAPVPGQKKDGERPDDLPPFDPINVWAYDECDLRAPSRAEVDRRVLQIMRLEEQEAVELEVSSRMLIDAGTAHAASTLTEALSYVESVLAKTNTVGFIHLGAQWAAVAANEQLLTRSGTTFKSPMGHAFVFGGGYVDGLESTIVATSQPYGWRSEVSLFPTMDETANIYAAVAERSVVIGYEALIAASTIA